MNIIITPTKLSGAITPPPSKSQAHRLLIAACLAGGRSLVSNVANSQDIVATLGCMEAMDAPNRRVDPSTVEIVGLGNSIPQSCCPGHTHCFDCGESGSTLRFLIPIALAVVGGGVFTGRGRLMERPQEPYFTMFREKGIFYGQKGGELTVTGTLSPGVYTLPGNVSSQFITGLLYALPLLGGDSEIRLTTPLESRGYVDMTLDALRQFGVRATYDGDCRFTVPGNQTYAPRDCAVEPDWSQAGFWYAGRGIGNNLETTGMNPASTQGDKILTQWAALLEGGDDVTLDVSGSPDLVPPIALWAALRTGRTTNVVNAARLRIKESDRLDTVTTELNKLGAKVEQGPDFLTIRGVSALAGGTVDSHNDHRIAMMLAIAATRATGPVTLHGAEAVDKSYPDFWDDYAALGGKFEVIA